MVLPALHLPTVGFRVGLRAAAGDGWEGGRDLTFQLSTASPGSLEKCLPLFSTLPILSPSQIRSSSAQGTGLLLHTVPSSEVSTQRKHGTSVPGRSLLTAPNGVQGGCFILGSADLTSGSATY